MRVFIGLIALTTIGLSACADASSGDCSDKGLCPADDAIDASVADARIDARALDARTGDAPIDANADANADVQNTPIDAASDGRTEPPHDAALDSPADGPEDASDDAPRDAMSDAPGDASDGGCVSHEICGNGFDDDCNGLTDCADPACTNYACVPSVPPGWSGPVTFLEVATPPPALPDCTAPYSALAYDGNAGANGASAQCGCTCGAVTGAQCAAPTVDLYGDSACATHCAGAQVPASACVPISTGSCGAGVYAKSLPPIPTGGSCSPQPSSSILAWHWDTAIRTCALPTTALQGGCASTSVCAPIPAAPFSGHLCVSAKGDLLCPVGSLYNVRHVTYSTATDTRACTSCTCASPTGGTCSGTFSTHNTSSCSLFTSTFPLSMACNSVQIATSGLKASTALDTASSCAPIGGQTVGGVTPGSPTTTCCTP